MSNQSQKPSFPVHHETGSVEAAVGILEFANQAKGFQGINKQRYSDFVVREVAKDGTVCHLMNMSGEELESQVFAEQISMMAQEASQSLDTLNVQSLMTELQGVEQVTISQPDAESLAAFMTQCLEESEECPAVFTSALECNNKTVRTALHQLFRKHAAKYVDTDTLKTGESSFIRMTAKHKQKGGRGGRDSGGGQNLSSYGPPKRRLTAAWPSNTPDYLQFTLCKENVDTMNAANFLGKLLHARQGSIAYAGTKDKRAITTQKCTIYRRKPSELTRINRIFTPYLLRVGDFRYVAQSASLGDLGGNRFGITLRALNQSEEQVATSCRALAESGFINYFGLQRFGQGDKSRSHDIGRAAFRGEWKAAVDMMFESRDGERAEIVKVKELYAQGSYKDAAKLAPVQLYGEKLILDGLAANPKDHLAAFSRLPKNTRLICAHAYQSYLWNMAASRRIAKFGLVCIEGDLVAVNPLALEAGQLDETMLDEACGEQEQLQSSSNETISKLDAGAVGNDFQSAKNKIAGAIRALTAEDIAAKTFSIRDVVLPICGSDSLLPSNEIGEFYSQMLHSDGLSLETFSTCSPVFRMSGAYRRILQMPVDFAWKILHYSDPNADLATTELTNARQRWSSTTPTAMAQEGVGRNEGVGGADGSGHLRAVSLNFTLPPGTYATMLLRELTKESTETQFQAQLTAQEDRKNDDLLKEAAGAGAADNEEKLESDAKKAKLC